MERSNTLHSSTNLHPVFEETLNGFRRISRILAIPRIPTEAELIEEYGVSPYASNERCESCFQPSETLVATLDGLLCQACMEVSRQQAEAELEEARA